MNVERILDLQEKAQREPLTEKEAYDLAVALGGGPITEPQKDYIELLLDQTGNDLDEYTNVPLDELTLNEASEIIDAIKEDLDGFH